MHAFNAGGGVGGGGGGKGADSGYDELPKPEANYARNRKPPAERIDKPLPNSGLPPRKIANYGARLEHSPTRSGAHRRKLD